MKCSKLGPLLGTMATLLISCAAPTTTISILNSPKANLSAYTRIAIADFQGNVEGARLISGLLVTELAKTGKFQLIERAELERIMKEHALEMSGVVDVQTAHVQKSFSATAEGLTEIERLPSKPEILHQLAEQGVHEFLAEIAPHYTQHTMKLEKGNKLGIQLAQSGLWSKAQEAFVDEVKINPSRPDAHYNLGVTLEAQGKLKEAENEYVAALVLKPKDLYVQAIRAIRQLTEAQ